MRSGLREPVAIGNSDTSLLRATAVGFVITAHLSVATSENSGDEDKLLDRDPNGAKVFIESGCDGLDTDFADSGGERRHGSSR